jgi:hypothetical protein
LEIYRPDSHALTTSQIERQATEGSTSTAVLGLIITSFDRFCI